MLSHHLVERIRDACPESVPDHLRRGSAVYVDDQGNLVRRRIRRDRKSTRLNSSHVKISYAVFCLKKKKSTVLHWGDAARDRGVARGRRGHGFGRHATCVRWL